MSEEAGFAGGAGLVCWTGETSTRTGEASFDGGVRGEGRGRAGGQAGRGVGGEEQACRTLVTGVGFGAEIAVGEAAVASAVEGVGLAGGRALRQVDAGILLDMEYLAAAGTPRAVRRRGAQVALSATRQADVRRYGLLVLLVVAVFALRTGRACDGRLAVDDVSIASLGLLAAIRRRPKLFVNALTDRFGDALLVVLVVDEARLAEKAFAAAI